MYALFLLLFKNLWLDLFLFVPLHYHQFNIITLQYDS